MGVGCGADEADGAGSPELGRAWTGAEASTWAAGLPAGDDGGMGVELSQAASRHATASAIAASILGGRPSRRVSASAARDIVHSLGLTACSLRSGDRFLEHLANGVRESFHLPFTERRSHARRGRATAIPIGRMTDLEAAWDEIHDVKPDGWFVGPTHTRGAAHEWKMYAFDTRERPKAGHRSRESEWEPERSGWSFTLCRLAEGRRPVRSPATPGSDLRSSASRRRAGRGPRASRASR